uniref:ABC transporter domain-containing protein n=1 Tax=Eutreptiella gymnastica TaxID=73025 RepID=A0A7S1IA94_9EUGL
MPQRSHLPPCLSLGALMTYPVEYVPDFDAELLDMAMRLGLDTLIQRVGGLQGVMDDWDQVLSGGEAQRVCIIRAIWGRPQAVVMDETTSALDLDTERMVFELMTAMGMAIISVGHRPSLKAYHDFLLDMTCRTARMSPLQANDTLCP